MVSEDTAHIIALIIVTLSYISIPALLVLLVFAVYTDLRYVVQFYYTRNPEDAVIAILLAFANAALLFGIRALIRWLRK